MEFRKIIPTTVIRHLVKYYWILEDKGLEIVEQKIIPDGFPEIICHLGDKYEIMINICWEKQSNFLLAGQLTRYFYLRNTGATKTWGIKFQPAAIALLFGFTMKECQDKVVSLSKEKNGNLKHIKEILFTKKSDDKKAFELNDLFEKMASENESFVPIQPAIDLIIATNGMVTIHELCASLGKSERQVLNLFNRYIGLSPKVYARVVRLNYIFKLVTAKKDRWTSRAHEAAYFDQAHFIKDFKKFTGENPSGWSFEEKNIANFFLSRQQ